MTQANERCIAEVGSYKRGWHSCNRRATFASERTIFVPTEGDTPITLHYCKRHEDRAHKTDSRIVRVVRVRAL